MDVDGERRINAQEFANGKDILVNQWHIKIDDANATFQELLKKYGAEANITFTQFCEYVIEQRLTEFDDLNSHDEI